MKILITGSNGFIAKEIIHRIEKNHPDWILYKTNRETLDILNPKEVNKFFERNKVDYEANLKTWTLRGWKPVEDKPKVNKVEIPKKGK